MKTEIGDVNVLIAALAGNPSFLTTFAIAMLWSAAWKGFALYRAASRRDLRWFIALFILNTLGILDAFYLLVVSEGGKDKEKKNGA